MAENPFQPPTTTHFESSQAESRRKFKGPWLILNLQLLVTSVYNTLEYTSHVLRWAQYPPAEKLMLWIANLSLVTFLCLGCWLSGLFVLEMVSLALRSLVAKHTDRHAWQSCLYRAIYRASILGIPGAILWLVWVFAFYRLGVNFYVISWAVGVPAHLLGAAVYVPLFFDWYKLRNQSRQSV